MFDPIFSSFGPLGSALLLFAILLVPFALVAGETLRSAHPDLGARFAELTLGWSRARGRLLGRVRRSLPPPIAYAFVRSDSRARDGSTPAGSGHLGRTRAFLRRVGSSATAQRRAR